MERPGNFWTLQVLMVLLLSAKTSECNSRTYKLMVYTAARAGSVQYVR